MSAFSQQVYKRNRIAEIEERANTRLADLLYQMHWQENLMHREIARAIAIPRPTVTRWFSELGVPSQPSERITKTYLTSWAYITGQKKPKPRYTGPNRCLQETRGGVNVRFFKTWSREMAYVLGYFAADGCLARNQRGSHYLQFTSTDIGLLRQVKRVMHAAQAIRKKTMRNLTPTWRPCYQIQIGSIGMYRDLLKLEITPRKASRLKLPDIPSPYLGDFTRGFFDGDGSVTFGFYRRKSRPAPSRLLIVVFTSKSPQFLKSLHQRLKKEASLEGGCVTMGSRAFRLQYSVTDSARLFQLMYGDLDGRPHLRRKYKKFSEALRFIGKGP